MKQITKKASMLFMLPLFFSQFFYNYKAPLGGDVYEVYLNKQLLVQEYVYEKKPVKTISLASAKPTDKLIVKYSHCGTQGKGRNVKVINGNKQVLKSWNFSDTGSNLPVNISDIPEIKNNETVSLVYSSKEIPDGKSLALIQNK